MFKTILVPSDGSALSGKAVDAAITFAKSNGSRIIALSVAEPYPLLPAMEATVPADFSEYDTQMRERAEQIVRKIAAAAKNAGVPCETTVVQSFNPYDEIVKAAEKNGCDAIFMASHGRKGLNKLFLGSETQKVLAHSSIPVLVLR